MAVVGDSVTDTERKFGPNLLLSKTQINDGGFKLCLERPRNSAETILFQEHSFSNSIKN